MGEFATGRVTKFSIFYLLGILTLPGELVGELSNIFSNSWGEFRITRVAEPEYMYHCTKFSIPVARY
jgi:hypothetical protein